MDPANNRAPDVPPPADRSGPPPLIPNHQLLRSIGHGSYGEVWLALNALGAWTAVKVVHLKSAHDRQVFDQEFRGLQRYDGISTSHESLMPIKSVGLAEDESFFYYAMELADDAQTSEPMPRPMPGDLSSPQDLAVNYQPRTLSALLRNGRLPPQECARHGLALAEALQRLHKAGLVHRDVKPANIILVGGRAKLADVGLVAMTEATVMSYVGTPEFMPYDGRGTASGDIYALGRVLYCLATGRPIADYNRGVENLKELPAAEQAALKELEAVYDRATQPSSAERYPSANALLEDLERLRDKVSVIKFRELQDRNRVLQAELQARNRRRKRIAVAAMVVGGLLAAGFWFWSWKTDIEHSAAITTLENERRIAGADRRAADTAHRADVANLENRQRSRMSQRKQGWSQDDWQFAETVARRRMDDSVQRLATATLSGLDLRLLYVWTNRADATSAAFSPDGQIVLSGYRFRHASLITDHTNRTELPVAGEGKVAWAADGEPLIFLVETNACTLREARTGRLRRAFPLAADEHGDLSPGPATALSADGARAAALVTRGESSRVVVWDARTGAVIGEHAVSASALTFTPDNSLLAVGRPDGTITVLHLDPFQVESSLPAGLGPNPIQSMDFAENRKVPLAGPGTGRHWLLAAGDRGTGIVIWDLSARRPLSFCRGSVWEVQSVAFHPDGLTLASAGRLGVALWDVMTGRQLLLSNKHSGSNTRALAFNAAGTQMIVGATGESSLADIALWEVEPHRGIQSLRGLSTAVRKVVFSPDGRRLAALADEWLLTVWDVADGRLMRMFELPAAVYADNAGRAFNADGTRLAFAAGNEARLFDLTSGRTLGAWSLPDGLGEELQFTRDGLLVLGRKERDPAFARLERWHIYELQPGQPPVLRHRQADTSFTTINVTLTAGAERLVVFGQDRTNRLNNLRAINTQTGIELWGLDGSSSFDWNVIRVDPSGRWCVAQLTPEMICGFIDITDGRQLAHVPPCWAIGPSGRDLVIAPDRWQSRSLDGTPFTITLGYDANPTADTHTFSPDGQRVAWGCEDGTVLVADLATVRQHLGRLAKDKTVRTP